jgi:hypothetical protein
MKICSQRRRVGIGWIEMDRSAPPRPFCAENWTPSPRALTDYDGPGDPEILNALVLLGEPSEDPVVQGTGRIGRLVEIMDGVAAAAELERRSEVTRVGKLTVREGNPGNDAVNNWIDAMMSIYRRITGKEPRTSVGGFNKPNEGIADGPLIRFLQAAAEPLKEINFFEDAWRSRVRTILRGASRQN